MVSRIRVSARPGRGRKASTRLLTSSPFTVGRLWGLGYAADRLAESGIVRTDILQLRNTCQWWLSSDLRVAKCHRVSKQGVS